MDLGALRREYRSRSLDRKDLKENPFEQLRLWTDEARETGDPEPNAMFLATASSSGIPSSRMVLLKKIAGDSLWFFSNKNSRKGQEIRSNPYVSATLYWKELERQVSIEGGVRLLPQADTEAYFHSRPRASQISAWASHQDEVLPDRKTLEEAFLHYQQKFANSEVPLPEYWQGYAIIPSHFCFWQGRESRLHDRFLYSKHKDGWTIDRLSP